MIKKIDDDRWAFPLIGCVDDESRIEFDLEKELSNLIKDLGYTEDDFLEKTGISFKLTKEIFLEKPINITWDNEQIETRLKFIKYQLQNKIEKPWAKYKWVNKQNLFDKKFKNCERQELLDRIHFNRSSNIKADDLERTLKAIFLRCVDVIVFRLKDREFEFLLLKRHGQKKIEKEEFHAQTWKELYLEWKRKPDRAGNMVQIGQWEYPKGGVYYHETLLEGTIRELLEETGVKTIEKFKYCADLSLQICNVRWRQKKDYNHLKVFGTTFQFIGEDKDIPLKKCESIDEFGKEQCENCKGPTFEQFGYEHCCYKWVSFEIAKNIIWMDYGKEFFNRWNNKRKEILAKAIR